jgi:hypothetical protein
MCDIMSQAAITASERTSESEIFEAFFLERNLGCNVCSTYGVDWSQKCYDLFHSGTLANK